MKPGEKIYTQHAEHTEWMSKLNFYKDEIVLMQQRLEELASKNNQSEVLIKIEHFQNQLIIQRNNIDELAHIIRLDETNLENEINKNPTAVDHRNMPPHSKEKESIDSFEKNFNELRTEFKGFAAKWM